MGLKAHIETKRGSLYQSSEDVKYIRRMGTLGERQKFEISRGSGTSFSYSIDDSLFSSDDEVSRQRTSMISQDLNFIEFCINSDVRVINSAAAATRYSMNSKARRDKVTGSIIDDDNPSVEKDTTHVLQKSVSAQDGVSSYLSPSESDSSSKASPKLQFSPIRKSFNPFTKSKSLRSPVRHKMDISEVKLTGTTGLRRSRTYQKSLLNDFSNTAKHSDIISEFINRDIQHSGIACSPVHLHGNVKLEYKDGVPFFEFKVKCPEEVFVAKTWRGYNASNWMYTFHSSESRKKRNATSIESYDCDKDSSMVAQLIVSSDLSLELKDGVFDDSMLMEFVLYDLTPSRQSVSSHKNSISDQYTSETVKASCVGLGGEIFKRDQETASIKSKIQHKLIFDSIDFNKSNSYPWLSRKLHPGLEIAAIVLQIPFHKRESLKYKRGDRVSAKVYPDLCDPSVVEQSPKGTHDSRNQECLKVVIPTGNHGLPNAESQGPSSLLDRWREGGGCDCGGWDMACPLILLGNPDIQFAEAHSFVGNYQPLELFVQGAKGSTPAFCMRAVEEGQYAVDFHAQLSSLQAFSICIAILHGTSKFSIAGLEKNQQLLQCNSLKMLIDEEAGYVIQSVSGQDEKRTAFKTQKGVPQSYASNSPFSAIA